jgi:hypothetical protein
MRQNIVLFCNGCKKGVYFKLSDNYNISDEYENVINIETENIVDYYPRLVPEIDPAIPKEIANDFGEAIKCDSVSASKATVTQCRRVMQNACVLMGANSKKDLIDQIDEIESKRIINPTLKEIAHTIRMIGNWGAHPQEDPLREVTPEDSSEILKFTSEFLDEVFVRPARIKSLKTKKGLK